MSIFNWNIQYIEKIWKNSLITALISSRLARIFKTTPSLLYTTSLVHRIGSILIFDILKKFNEKADFKDYLSNEFALRVGNSFNKRLSVSILKKWNFTENQIDAVNNYNIKPSINTRIEHKILYLSQITVGALDVILKDYDKNSIFPYTFMINESSLELDAKILKKIVEDSVIYYKQFLKFLHS